MRTLCLSLIETPNVEAAARKHFAERGVEAEFYYGIHAKHAGLFTTNEYNVDHPNEHFNMGAHGVGIYVSFYMMWNVMLACGDEHILLIEHDAEFDENWKYRFDQAMLDVPKDFDFLFLGSCCAEGKPTTHIKGEVFEVKYPLCNHACVIARKCLPFLISNLRKCWAPIDLQLMFEAFLHLNVYTVLPRMVKQFNTEIPE
jgi:hypothetical protein